MSLPNTARRGRWQNRSCLGKLTGREHACGSEMTPSSFATKTSSPARLIQLLGHGFLQVMVNAPVCLLKTNKQLPRGGTHCCKSSSFTLSRSSDRTHLLNRCKTAPRSKTVPVPPPLPPPADLATSAVAAADATVSLSSCALSLFIASRQGQEGSAESGNTD